MMGGFEEPDDPARAKKLLNGLEEAPEGLLKRMERLGEEDKEMPTCAVCFDSLLQFAEDREDDGKGYEPSEPGLSSSVPMDVDTESTTSNDPAISSTASTSGSTSAETVQEDEGGSLQTTVDGILVRGRRRR